MGLALEIVSIAALFVPVVVVGYFFIWAAKKDGEDARDLRSRRGR